MPIRLATNERYGGQMGLRQRFGLNLPPPFVISILGASRQGSDHKPDHQVNRYPASYDRGNDAISDLKFSLRYEPLELGLLKAAFREWGPAPMIEWIRREPSGQFCRRAWFLYEWLLGDRLDVPDARLGRLVPVLDPERQIGLTGETSRRHRVLNNLLGTPLLCPTVRKTPLLHELQGLDLAKEARQTVAAADPAILARAVDYIYHKETRSSFALEKEEIATDRAALFIQALRQRAERDLMRESDQTALRNLIIGDDRYAEPGWRQEQNYIGEGLRTAHFEKVHFIPPRPEDVRGMMQGLEAMMSFYEKSIDFIISGIIEFNESSGQLSDGDSKGCVFIDPVLIAAIIGFSFVFIHPFLDGNGRMHRLIIHDVLERLGFTPPDIIIPISAVMLRDRRAYDAALERFSKNIMPYIDWARRDDEDGQSEVVVKNDTADLYRYFDATPQVEYLYGCLRDAIRTDLKNELDYLARFDRGVRALMERSAMPDRKAQLFVNLLLQNGRIGAAKRQSQFAELTEDEVDTLETIVLAAMQATPG